MHSYSAGFYKYGDYDLIDQGTWQLPPQRNQNQSAATFNKSQNQFALHQNIDDDELQHFDRNSYRSQVDTNSAYGLYHTNNANTNTASDSINYGCNSFSTNNNKSNNKDYGGYTYNNVGLAMNNDSDRDVNNSNYMKYDRYEYDSTLPIGTNRYGQDSYFQETNPVESYSHFNRDSSTSNHYYCSDIMLDSEPPCNEDTEMQRLPMNSSASNTSTNWKQPYYNTGRAINNRRGNRIRNRTLTGRSRGSGNRWSSANNFENRRQGSTSQFNSYDTYKESEMCRQEEPSHPKNNCIVTLNAANFNKWGYLRKNFQRQDNELVQHLFEIHDKFCSHCSDQMKDRSGRKRKRPEEDNESFVNESGEEIKDENLTSEALEIQKVMGFSGFKSQKFDKVKESSGNTGINSQDETTPRKIPFGAPAVTTSIKS